MFGTIKEFKLGRRSPKGNLLKSSFLFRTNSYVSFIQNLKTSKSVLIREATSANAEKFTVQGRLVLVAPAVNKAAAEQISSTEKKEKKVDRRNYYLLREGVIFPQSEAGKKLGEKELQKRQESYTSRKQQLTSNPSLLVSKTRLAVRNLPLETDEKTLKSLAHSAVDKFKVQVQRGLRKPLTVEEKAEGWDKKANVIQVKSYFCFAICNSNVGLG